MFTSTTAFTPLRDTVLAGLPDTGFQQAWLIWIVVGLVALGLILFLVRFLAGRRERDDDDPRGGDALSVDPAGDGGASGAAVDADATGGAAGMTGAAGVTGASAAAGTTGAAVEEGAAAGGDATIDEAHGADALSAEQASAASASAASASPTRTAEPVSDDTTEVAPVVVPDSQSSADEAVLASEEPAALPADTQPATADTAEPAASTEAERGRHAAAPATGESQRVSVVEPGEPGEPDARDVASTGYQAAPASAEPLDLRAYEAEAAPAGVEAPTDPIADDMTDPAVRSSDEIEGDDAEHRRPTGGIDFGD